MIIVDKAILSDDLADEKFVCDLSRCKGACCVEGDLGAPLEESELEIMNSILPDVLPYLSDQAKAVIEKEGAYILDSDGDYSTTTINNKDCVFVIYDEKNIAKCGIEQAHRDGKIDFKKPISCHLYPIRVTPYGENEALNYHRWEICEDACVLGEQLKVPVYKFLKEPLIRKYGADWFSKLEKTINDTKKK